MATDEYEEEDWPGYEVGTPELLITLATIGIGLFFLALEAIRALRE